jgi:hypothetical protein
MGGTSRGRGVAAQHVAHRFHDVLVAGAAAEIARQRLANRRVVGVRMVAGEDEQRQQEARRAEATLEGVVAAEGFLEGVET